MDYEPGKCNIDSRERVNRAILGASGLLASALMAGLIVYQGLPDYLLIFTFIPLFLGFEGVFQALTSFCAHYAHKGVYVEGQGLAEVEDEKDRELDEKKAMKIHVASLLASAFTSAFIFFSLTI